MARNEKQAGQQMDAMGKDSSDVVEAVPLTWMFWRKQRYIVVLLAFLGMFTNYALRVNLSVAIVAMTENRSYTDDDGNEYWKQEFPWDSKEKGHILSSFFYGYIFTQFFGGLLGAKIGGNIVFGWGIGLTAILTLLTPLAANHSMEMLLAVRILEGVCEGVTFPSIHAVWSRWAPPLERSRMASIAFAGTYVGTVVTLPASGKLATAYGWESIFYVFGGFGAVWLLIWVLFVRSGPEKDRFCSQDEREYIHKKIGFSGATKTKHPWGAIFRSSAFYACAAAHFTSNWGFYLMLTNLPTFLTDTLNYDLDTASSISAAPYLTMAVLLSFSGYLADWLQVKGYLTTGQVRRYFNIGSFLSQTVFLMMTPFLVYPILSVISITLAVSLGAFSWSAWAVNYLDIAPKHASVLMGLGNTIATVPGIVGPMLAGYIVDEKSMDEWTIVFAIASVVYLIGSVITWFWVSGEVQPWARVQEDNSAGDNRRT